MHITGYLSVYTSSNRLRSVHHFQCSVSFASCFCAQKVYYLVAAQRHRTPLKSKPKWEWRLSISKHTYTWRYSRSDIHTHTYRIYRTNTHTHDTHACDFFFLYFDRLLCERRKQWQKRRWWRLQQQLNPHTMNGMTSEKETRRIRNETILVVRC